jgi:hypothetical protein
LSAGSIPKLWVTQDASLTGGIVFGLSPAEANAKLSKPMPGVEWTCLPVATDMGRDSAKRPTLDNTAEDTSRCAADMAADIWLACRRSGEQEVCSVDWAMMRDARLVLTTFCGLASGPSRLN